MIKSGLKIDYVPKDSRNSKFDLSKLQRTKVIPLLTKVSNGFISLQPFKLGYELDPEKQTIEFDPTNVLSSIFENKITKDGAKNREFDKGST